MDWFPFTKLPPSISEIPWALILTTMTNYKTWYIKDGEKVGPFCDIIYGKCLNEKIACGQCFVVKKCKDKRIKQ